MRKSVGFCVNIYCSAGGKKEKEINHSTASLFVSMENVSNKFSHTRSFTCVLCAYLEEVEFRTAKEETTNCFTGKMYLKFMNTSEH